jgi:hypothetical protein
VTVLVEPAPTADTETIAAYLEQLARARRDEDQVIVVQFTGREPRKRGDVDGVEYVRNEWEAPMAVLAGQRSELGNVNRLDDVLKGLSGNVLGAVANPPGDVHTGWLRRSA